MSVAEKIRSALKVRANSLSNQTFNSAENGPSSNACESEQHQKARKRGEIKKWPLLLLTLFVLVCILSGAIFYYLRPLRQAAALEPVTVSAARGNISVAVNATGNLRPVSIVRVSTQQGGVVDEIFVDFTSEVRKGQLLATFNSETQKIDLENAKVEVKQALLEYDQAKIRHQAKERFPETLRKSMNSAKAEVNAAEISLNVEENAHRRQVVLAERGIVSQKSVEGSSARVASAKQNIERARAAYARSLADYEDALGAISQSRLDVEEKQNAIELARNRLERAEINLERTKIFSPVDGTIVWKALDVGQTISVNVELPTLFYIAQDLAEMQVEASVDEADIAKIRLGQTAKYTVSAYPGRVFEGKVKQIRTGSDALYGTKSSVSSAVSYIVVITAPNNERMLFPGMTASVRIESSLVENQWLVPNQALRVAQALAKAGNIQAPNDKSLFPLFIVNSGGQPAVTWVRPGPSDGTYTAVGPDHPHINDKVQYIIARRSKVNEN